VLRIGEVLLKPSFSREPQFSSLRPSSPSYSWECVSCGGAVSLGFQRMLADGLYDGQSEFGADDWQLLRESCGIGLVGKSHDGGWPWFRRVPCPQCGRSYIVYVGVDEPSNSIYTITVQSVLAVGAEESEDEADASRA
jgi:hypothetical protein